MTKDEIKKALKTCSVDSCTDCPYDNEYPCATHLKQDALALITEQEKEIEQLKEEIKQAKIGALNEIKWLAEHCDQWNCEVVPTKYIDAMIEELQK